MNIALIITSIISLATLIVSIYNARTLNENKEKDRRIAVLLSEKRRMQNNLFEHITKVLDLGRRCFEEKGENEKQKMKFELLNHKIYIWINLDRDNGFAKGLRENSNEYIFLCASFLDSSDEAERLNFQKVSYKDQRSIWILIDKYIEEENKLIEELM
ncbi:hypothetical protein [Peribacillus frigoritolerans]|uniref:Uncharacterized protein n=1 Tax=Peribacillus frigoritolerans TaxID=450367 RepID=A0AAJ1QQ69_9BACI|nr:hypothetical protein [Peribacillus frigoritolerans]MDM5285796.1 hypothetical protein [Peribacillus frigoritolerans]